MFDCSRITLDFLVKFLHQILDDFNGLLTVPNYLVLPNNLIKIR